MQIIALAKDPADGLYSGFRFKCDSKARLLKLAFYSLNFGKVNGVNDPIEPHLENFDEASNVPMGAVDLVSDLNLLKKYGKSLICLYTEQTLDRTGLIPFKERWSCIECNADDQDLNAAKRELLLNPRYLKCSENSAALAWLSKCEKEEEFEKNKVLFCWSNRSFFFDELNADYPQNFLLAAVHGSTPDRYVAEFNRLIGSAAYRDSVSNEVLTGYKEYPKEIDRFKLKFSKRQYPETFRHLFKDSTLPDFMQRFVCAREMICELKERATILGKRLSTSGWELSGIIDQKDLLALCMPQPDRKISEKTETALKMCALAKDPYPAIRWDGKVSDISFLKKSGVSEKTALKALFCSRKTEYSRSM